jgi:hypothetical protein
MFVDDLLAEMDPGERRCVKVGRGRCCLAAVGASVRRRLLIIDGDPPDLSAGVLIEMVQMTDPQLPIVLVRNRRDGAPLIHNGVRMCSGPFVSRQTQLMIIESLAGGVP